MEVAMVSRYMDPVELSWTILLTLMLEILGVILSTADMSVEVLSSDCASSSILVRVMVLAKPRGRVEGHPTASTLVSGNVGMVRAPSKWVDGQVGVM